ncbi:MAG: efflux RND transporter permease subunit [Verrucomicrobiota bacterium]
MPNPAAFTLNNSRTAIVIYLGILLFGILTYLNIGSREYPAFTIRNAIVITSYPGRSSEQVEQEVTEPLEQAIRQMPEVDEIESTSKPGISIITVTVAEQYFDMEDIWTDMRNKVSAVQLPSGSSKPAINDEFGDQFPYIYALKGDGYTPAELEDYGDVIRDRLLAIDGVGKVEFHGEQDERVYLEFSSSELAAYGITPTEISNVLSSQNAIVDSGDANHGDERIQIVTLGEFESLEELANYQLALTGQSTSLRVSDLFTIRRDYLDPAQSLSHFNGEPVLCISVSALDGQAVTKVGERITTALEEIQKELPLGLEIETMFYQPVYITDSINSFLENLGQAFAFVIVIMFIFSGWRLAVLVSILIPSAILLCFCLMPSVGVELEMMSIAALIIALGIMVDNAVVVCEQILRRLNEGADRKSAVIDSVGGLIIPLLAGSGTTIAAFGVIAMAEGSTAEFVFSLFAVVSLTLLGSWLMSITIIPFFCYGFLKPLKKDTFVGRAVTAFNGPYEAILRFAIKTRWLFLILIFAATVVAMMGMKYVPSIFFPPNERNQFVIDFELPQGKSIEETESEVSRFEQWLLTEKKDEVMSVSSWIGDGGPRWYLSLSPEQANPNYAFLSVLTTSSKPEDVAQLIDEINTLALEEFPAARISPKALESGPPVGDPIQIKIRGEDMDTLYNLRDQVAAIMRESQGTYDIRDSWGAWTKQVTIDPDQTRLSRLGLSTQSLGAALSLQYEGTPATNYREDDKSIPVLLRSKEDFRENLDQIRDLPVFGAQSGIIPLSQAADIRIDFQPGAIERYNTTREMNVKCRVSGRFSSEALAEIQPKVEALTASSDWPLGYTVEIGGEQAESADAQKKLAAGAPIPIAILCLILIAQFNSLRAFAIIMMTIPPMMIGVVPGLLVTGSSFGFMTLLGLIALMGIVVNNAILLLDETRLQLAQDDKPFLDCIVDSAKSRLRPILMTTATTVFGLVPLALGGGGMWSSMAYAMMFGLSFATVLTLLLCPTLFYIFHKKQYDPESKSNNLSEDEETA